MQKVAALICLVVVPSLARGATVTATLKGHTLSADVPEGWSGGGQPSGDTFTAQYTSPAGDGMVLVAGARDPTGPLALDSALGSLLEQVGPPLHLAAAGAPERGRDANGYPVRLQALRADDGRSAVAVAVDGGPIFVVVILVSPARDHSPPTAAFDPVGRSLTIDGKGGPWRFSAAAAPTVEAPRAIGGGDGDQLLPDRLSGNHALEGAYWCHYRSGRWVWWVFNADGYVDLKRPPGWNLVTAGKMHTEDLLEAYRVSGRTLETQFRGEPIKTHQLSRRSGALVIDGDLCRRWDHDYSGTRLLGKYSYSFGGQYASGYGSIVFGAGGTLTMSGTVAATSYTYGQVTGSGYASDRPRTGHYRIQGAEMFIRWEDGKTQTADFYTDSGTTDPSHGIYVDGTRYMPQR